jgi:hypothetical protein
MMSLSFAGTPAFMAPEIYAGKGGKRSDQYSLAFTYAELRLGRRPLEGDDFYTVMKSTLEMEPNLGTLPPAEQAVVRKALAKKPEDRFETCEDFVDALEQAVAPGGKAPRRRPQAIPRGSPLDSDADTLRRAPPSGPPERRRLSPSATLQPSEIKAMAAAEAPPPSPPADGTMVAIDTPKAKPAVWKPGAPQKQSSALMRLLLGTISLVAVGAIIAAAVVFWNRGDRVASTTPTSPPATSESKTTIASTSERTVEKKYFLPARFQAPSDAKLRDYRGQKYYDRIVFPAKDGSAATFLLILPLSDADPRPFYMMENKVWNALYREFAATPGPDRLPVMNVTFTQAQKFAQWLGGLLPTARQWDHAAGITQHGGRSGPALGNNVAIDHDAPLAVGSAADDISPFLVRDLAGNGREFTRDRLTAEDGENLVVLRGRSFKYRTPLTYEMLLSEKEAKNTQTQHTDKASPYTGFRVVIEVGE